ncbi:MAG: DUF342 domain-containing protein [Proteobacteria bacterium]|nr:DUF342 domain-containing protein [Pseudomonadota bacterium]
MTKDIMIKAICPSCGAINGVSLSFIGKKIICQQCEDIFVVADSEENMPAGSNRESIDAVPEPISPEPEILQTVRSNPAAQAGNTRQIPVIAKLALIYKFIDKNQCMQVLSRWKQEISNGKKITLEDIFKITGMLTPSQIDHLNASKDYLEIKKADKLICSLALEKGFILPSEATWAMETQARTFRESKNCIRVGDILLKAEALTENEYQLLIREYDEYAGQDPELSISNSDQVSDSFIRNEEDIKKSIQIKVSDDCLRAFLSLSKMTKGVTLDDVKKIMSESMVNYGIVEDTLIENFINDWAGPDKQLKIAEGIYPVQGENAFIRFLFEVDHLKAGTLSEDGVIDYKNRGAIPFVRKGELLAEKIPVKQGKTGVDVYGYPVEVEEMSDIELMAGDGVHLSEDKNQIYADIDGYPNARLGQVVSVYPGLDIKGDVGYETGHVVFDGHIKVEGIVKEGFKVKGTSLSAQEIVGGEIDVSGDVVVYGGIIGSTIKAQGNVDAMYLRNSKVAVYGNVIIGKQISDSTILSSGACHVLNGLIVSSDISAKKGIRAKDIGTDMSSPNRLRVGVDRHVEMEIERIRQAISEKKNLREALAQELQKIDTNLNSVYNVIAEMAHFQDRILHKKEAIMETIDKFNQKSKNRKLVHAEKALQEIEDQVKANDETMDRLFATQNAYQDKIAAINEKIKAVDNEILERDVEKKAILQWSSRDKGDTTIQVTGAISEKTTIFGVHSSKILPDTYKNVRIKEARIHDPDSTSTWEIRIYESGWR